MDLCSQGVDSWGWSESDSNGLGLGSIGQELKSGVGDVKSVR